MRKINDILKKNNISGNRYRKNGKCIIIDNRYVIKPNKTNIYEYLNYRNFDNYPNVVIDDGYEIIDYIPSIDIPTEQKMIDLINVISVLHKKTTYYKKISEFDLDKIYNNIKDKISSVKNIYNNLITKAESSIYMSPSDYLLARNISFVYSMIDYSNNNIELWYKKIKDTDKVRVSIIHNNLNLEHFINNILISWDNSKVSLPIFDLYKLYLTTYNEYDWNELINIYSNNYPLKEDELVLFNTLISIPLVPSISNIEIDNVKDINEKLNYLKVTNNYIFTKKDEIKI